MSIADAEVTGSLVSTRYVLTSGYKFCENAHFKCSQEEEEVIHDCNEIGRMQEYCITFGAYVVQ